METLYVDGTPAATGVETLVSAVSYLSPAEWALAVGGFVVGAATVALARAGRSPREDMVSREIRKSAERHRASDAGFITLLASSLLCAVAGLVLVVVADDRGEAAFGVAAAAVGVVGAVVDMVRRRRARTAR